MSYENLTLLQAVALLHERDQEIEKLKRELEFDEKLRVHRWGAAQQQIKAAMKRLWDPRSTDNRRGTLVVIDGDRLKLVNDEFGLIAGDALIRAIAHALSGSVRPTDIVARRGGESDEFLVFMPGASRSVAIARMEEAREWLDVLLYELGDKYPGIKGGFSYGIVQRSRRCSLAWLSHEAEKRMRRDKFNRKAGR